MTDDELDVLDRELFDGLRQSASPDERGLAAALRALRDETEGQASRHPKKALPRRQRLPRVSRRGSLTLALAAAALLLGVFQSKVWAQTLGIRAPLGMLHWSGSQWSRIVGHLELELPARLRTTDGEAEMVASSWTGTITPRGEMNVDEGERVTVLDGAIELTSKKRVHCGIAKQNFVLEGRLGARAMKENSMRNSHRAGLGGVVGVLALYAGTLAFEDGDDAEVVEGPLGLVLQADGKRRRVPLEEARELVGLRDREGPMGDRADTVRRVPESPDETTSTGGYWDEDAATVRFALSGEVFDAMSGAPIETFVLEAEPIELRGFGAPLALERKIEDAAEGSFMLEPLGLGTWRVTVRSEGYAPTQQVVSLTGPAEDPYLVVPLSPGAIVSGVVSDWRGKPVDEATVRLAACGGKDKTCPVAKTDRHGTFFLHGVPEERPVTLHAEHARYGSEVRPNVLLEAGESKHVDIQLNGIMKVFGHVWRGEQGAPAPGITIRGKDVETITDDGGYYELRVPLGRRASVWAVLGKGTKEVRIASYPKTRSAEPIEWRDGEDHVAILSKDFFLAVEDAVLSGRLTDARGHPVANAELEFMNTLGFHKGPRGHQSFPEGARTDAQGLYRIENIPAHAGYEVVLVTERGRDRLGMVVIEEPAEVVANFSVSSGTIRGRFLDRRSDDSVTLDPATCGAFGAKAEASAAIYLADCLEDGAFEFRDVPPGEYLLTSISPGQFKDVEIDDQRVSLEPGQHFIETEVRVRAKKLIRMRARILDGDGRFVREPVMRFQYGKSGSRTSSLSVKEDGTVEFTVPSGEGTLHIDAVGYESAEIDPALGESGEVVVIRLKRARR